MVGCGAFPATLLWLRDNFPTPRYVGLDIDPACVKLATELAAALGVDKVHFELADGRNYDFGGADFVYVANHGCRSGLSSSKSPAARRCAKSWFASRPSWVSYCPKL